MHTFKNILRAPICILAIFMLASLALAGCSQKPVANPITYRPEPYCTQKAVIAVEKYTMFLNPAEAAAPIPQDEPQIVATVHRQTITAKQLEMMVQNTLYTDQLNLANAGPGTPANMTTLETLSPAQVRQMRLTSIIDNAIWLSVGKQHGEEAAVTTAQQQLRQSLSIFKQSPAKSSARFQFEAFLCANHLTETSYTTDPRIVQNVRDSITAATAKRHEQTLLAATPQNGRSVQQRLDAYIQALWSKNNVKVFLTGFVPLRIDPQIQ